MRRFRVPIALRSDISKRHRMTGSASKVFQILPRGHRVQVADVDPVIVREVIRSILAVAASVRIHLHSQATTHKVYAVEFADRLFTVTLSLELNEGKSCLKLHSLDPANLLHQPTQISLSDFVRNIGDVNLPRVPIAHHLCSLMATHVAVGRPN